MFDDKYYEMEDKHASKMLKEKDIDLKLMKDQDFEDQEDQEDSDEEGEEDMEEDLEIDENFE